MPTIVVAILIVIGIPFVIFLLMCLTSPEGYEDDEGFHRGH